MNVPHLTRYLPQFPSGEMSFFMTAELIQNRPIYVSGDGSSFLRPYATFWVISDSKSGIDFKFFIEDMATCPNFADQTGWGFISGLTNYDDNRISVTCVQRKIRTMSSSASQKNSPVGSSCCRQVNLIIPSSHKETGLAEFASVYTFNADLSDGENTYYINSKGNTLKKIGNSLWGIAFKHSDTNFKMYVGKQPKCPEDIKQQYGLWHYFSSINSMWTADNRRV